MRLFRYLRKIWFRFVKFIKMEKLKSQVWKVLEGMLTHELKGKRYTEVEYEFEKEKDGYLLTIVVLLKEEIGSEGNVNYFQIHIFINGNDRVDFEPDGGNLDWMEIARVYSILSTFRVNLLEELNEPVQYYLARHERKI